MNMMVTITLIAFVIFLVANVPIAYSLAFSGLLGIMLAGGRLTGTLVAQLLYAGTDSYALLAIPFFMLAGSVMQAGGLSKRLIDFANICIGHFQGGLGVVAIVTCMFFAAISGSGPATVAAVGGIMIPSMIEAGYDKKYAAALVSISGAIGCIIPPSIPMVVYAVQSGASVGTIFIGGVIPGILFGVVLMIINYFVSKKNGYGGVKTDRSMSKIFKSFKEAFFALLMPVIILGGIYGGIFTATEAAGVAVIYALFISTVIYRELTIAELKKMLIKTGIGSATVMIIVMGAQVFAYVVVGQGVPDLLVNFITGITSNKILIMLFINILLLIVGCFLDSSSAIIVLAPMLIPLATTCGVNLVHFGIIMVVNLSIGLVTPPVGLNLFVGCNTAKITISEIIPKLIPLLIAGIIVLMLVTYFPEISLFVPRLAGMRV